MIWQEYRRWLTDPYFDEATRAEVAGLSPAEVEDRFWTDLSFGTGGLRGKLGAGTNRMNRYVVRRATQGLAQMLLASAGGGSALQAPAGQGLAPGSASPSVAIAYDSRHYSADFALEAALVLAANGVRAYLFDALRPTPLLSFAVRHLGCQAGIVITASHNPPEYNGYKVYGADGAQLGLAESEAVLAEMRAVSDLRSIVPMARSEALAAGLLRFIGAEVDEAYLEQLRGLSLGSGGSPLRIVYTPLHGAGGGPVPQALGVFGFTDVVLVPSQAVPDGAFPTVASPNPEDPRAFALALELAARVEADLVLATDPDADRLGVAVRVGSSYQLLNGNQVGALLTEYLLSRLAALGRLPSDGLVVKTIATSNLARAICSSYGVTLAETLTGFKFIAEKISGSFLFGFEESYGYLAGTFVRDKDGVMAACLVAEAAAYWLGQGLTLVDVLVRLHEQHGFYVEEQDSFVFEGRSGMEQMATLMGSLRASPLSLPGLAAIDDYLSGVGIDLTGGVGGSLADGVGSQYSLTLPQSDALHYRLADGGFVLIRPSGTEPKLKIYYSAVASSASAAQERLALLRRLVRSRLS